MQYARALQQLILRYERKYLRTRSSREKAGTYTKTRYRLLSKRAGSILEALSRAKCLAKTKR